MISKKEQAADLRRKAEKKFQTLEPTVIDALSKDDVEKLFHELRVHQIELEMQNDELRQTQDELDLARSRYFDLYDLAPVGYFTVSEKGLILESNLTLTTLLGTPRSALVKNPISQFILKEDQDIYYLHRKKLFDTGEPQQCELRLLKSDGEPLWARLDATAAQDADGALTCRIILTDVTEHKQAEAALQQSEERFRRAVVDSPFPIMLHAEDGQIIQVSNSWCEITGYTHEELATVENWTERAYGERKSQVQAYIDNLYNLNHPVVEGEYVIQIKSGGTRIWDFSSGPLGCLPDGRRLIMSMAMDITERKQVEEERRERLKELDCLYAVSREILADLSLEELCRRTVKHLISAMQFPEITVPVIEVKDKRFTSENHSEGLSCGLHAKIGTFGNLSVYYAEERPFHIPEEQDLVDGVAHAISMWLVRKQAEEQLQQKLDELKRWQTATLGREGRVAELKTEVNELAARLGEPPPYGAPENIECKEGQ